MFTGIIVRKTLGECLRYSALILCGLLILGIPGLVMQRLIVYNIPYTYMPHLIVYILPECLQFLLPISLMLGTIVTFVRMGAENEILALKSMGIQPIRLIYPLLLFCFIISFGAWYICDVSAICRECGIRNILLNGADEIVYSMLRSKGEIKSSKLRVKVDRVVDDRLINVVIHYNHNDEKNALSITAKEARIIVDKEHREFLIELKEGVFRHGSAKGNFNQEKHPFPIAAFLSHDATASLTNATMVDIISGLADLRNKIKRHKQNLANETGIVLLTGELGEFNKTLFEETRSTLNHEEDLLKKTMIEPYRRFTLGFTCLCLVMISAPLAIQNNKMNVITSFILCAGPTLALFAVLFSIGLNLGKQGILPPWGICMADVILLAIGISLIVNTANK